jgi:8-oxo-dGTP diphosphatase
MAEKPAYVVNVDVAVRRQRDGDGEYLFIVRGADEDHAPGTLGFPGGTLEAPPGESGVLAATAAREVREEVGVDVDAVSVVTSTTFELDTGRPCLNVVVTADYAGGDAHVAAPDEVDGVAWRTPDAVLGADETPPWTADLLESVLDSRRD